MNRISQFLQLQTFDELTAFKHHNSFHLILVFGEKIKVLVKQNKLDTRSNSFELKHQCRILS